MAEMDALVKQTMAMIGELHGLVDKLQTEVSEVAARAASQKKAATEYDALLKKIGEAQAKLDTAKTDLAQADRVKTALKEIAARI